MQIIDSLPKDLMDETQVILPCAGIDDEDNCMEGTASIDFIVLKFQIDGKEKPLSEDDLQNIYNICDSMGVYGEPWSRSWSIWREQGLA